MRATAHSFRGLEKQRGIALYIALIILLILTLLGLVAVQITTMQERMAGNYRTVNLAFQNAESRVRDSELEIGRTVTAGTAPIMTDNTCANFNIDSWANQVDVPDADATAIRTRRVDRCSGTSSGKYGQKVNDDTNSIYQITGAASDRATDGSTVVVIETVFIP
ncbi:MAG: protein PilX [Arenimonas sp.]|uniref:pilus assembly PilX family protein n=1 Tax=Arenimonas sp. TaxID=1872635 RepID=UPI0025BC86E0|nr:PilX N-terminal domain-containing pilus assembly protein [Arenimonas sp.]MBW8368679.1 protein PilX [Arenimonas sp.]